MTGRMLNLKHGAAESYCCVETFIVLKACAVSFWFIERLCKGALETETTSFLCKRAVCVVLRMGREFASIGATTSLKKHFNAQRLFTRTAGKISKSNQ